MPDYLKGMIYMLEPSCKHDIKDIYYGSTTQPLHDRFHSHKSNFITNREKHVSKSKILFEKYGVENIKIVLVKYYPCNTKQELEAEESIYIRNNECINTVIPGRSKKEYYQGRGRELDKIYRDNNSNKIKEKLKCDCGSEVKKYNLKEHEKTKKHICYLFS